MTGAPADLVVQGPDLSAQAIAAFRDRFASAPLRKRAASVRFEAAGQDPQAATHAAQLAERWRCDATLVAPGIALADFRVLALDMDSTLIGVECIDELAKLAGRGAEVTAITEAAMRGEIADFATSLRRRVALLAGADASLLERVARERMQLSPGGERLLQAARQAGLRTLLVTGGFTFFAQMLRSQLRIDTVCANELQIRDGRLTGEVRAPAQDPQSLVDSQGKARALLRACADAGCTAAQAIAIGDGANDLPMLSLAGVGVAYRAKPLVRSSAAYRLDYSGLDGVLEWFRAPSGAPLHRREFLTS
ncbi:MAG: phosphoserine phosphatase SerB [Burkholderiaceae bacterium]|nr:phosphoserine phosphatase SerB [Burkholderiaceae bacterium]